MKINAQRIIQVTVIVAVLMFATRGVCLAQDATPQKKALAEELISLMHLSESMRSVVDERLKVEASQNPNASEEEKSARRRAIEQAYNMDAFKPVWAEIYAETFTEDELRGLIAFFKGPVGSKWIEKQREVQEKTSEKMQAFAREAESKLSHDGIPAEALRSATFSYQTQINTIVLQAVVPELAKHVNLLKGSVNFSFRLDRHGHLSRLKVTSSTSNRFVEETAIQMIRATTFPPIPKQVIAEQGHDYVDVDSAIDINRQ